MLPSDIWKLLAGLGLFLYGMFHLEETMKQIEGRGFKLFLKKYTQKKWSAILIGTGVTGVMQSSSIVNLTVLSLVGAGVLSMRNALSVALGANVGGTFNSWLVALLGFEIDMEILILPIISIAGIGLVIFKSRKNLYRISKFFIGFGLLLLGLAYTKQSMEMALMHFNFAPYLEYSGIVFLLIGFVITALIQTSAATVVIVLSALNSKVIPIETGILAVIGAELGTTIKVLIGSIGGIAAKKRVAIGNIIFNIITSFIGYLFLRPILHFLQNTLQYSNPVFILVAFQTLINLLGVILFYFLIEKMAFFLERRFNVEPKSATCFIQHESEQLPATALEALHDEAGLFIYRTIRINLEVFQLEREPMPKHQFDVYDQEGYAIPEALTYKEKYNYLKQSEGEILLFYSKMCEQKMDKEVMIKVGQLISAVKSAMYAAKGMKDINHNRIEWSSSINDLKYSLYQQFKAKLKDFYFKIFQCLSIDRKSSHSETLQNLINQIKDDSEELVRFADKLLGNDTIKDIDVATVFNVNRELYESCKFMIFSLKDFLLTPNEAEVFENRFATV